MKPRTGYGLLLFAVLTAAAATAVSAVVAFSHSDGVVTTAVDQISRLQPERASRSDRRQSAFRDEIAAEAAATTVAPPTTMTSVRARRTAATGRQRPPKPASSTAAPAPSTTTTAAGAAGGRWSTAEASWYGPGFYGNKTACGQVYNERIVGVAHKTLACGTMVTFEHRGRTVTAPVIDRGPYTRGRMWDLSAGLCRALGHCFTGPIHYRIGG